MLAIETDFCKTNPNETNGSFAPFSPPQGETSPSWHQSQRQSEVCDINRSLKFSGQGSRLRSFLPSGNSRNCLLPIIDESSRKKP
jgi:hypothetical protein